MIQRRRFVQGVALLAAAPVLRARAELPAATQSALAESEVVYLTPLKSNGEESRCKAEIWFVAHEGGIYRVTAAEAWRARAVRQGLTRARVWVGEFGTWTKVASRDPDRYMPYCSRVCCMYTAKQAKIYKEQIPDGQPYIFYMDIRSDCKGYEEFLQKTIEEKGLLYLRGRVSRVFQDDGKVRILGVDTLTGRMVEVAADMVVLATAMVPSQGVKDLAAKLRATVDRHGFLTEAHIKLYPVESSTKGIYLAGCGQGPKDISDTVSQASATASKIQALLSTDKLLQDP